MRIAWIVTGGLHPSGREQVIPALVDLLAHLARSEDVHAFALHHLEEPQQYPLHGVVVHDLGRPAGWWTRWQSLTRALGEAGPFDIIHGYWGVPAGILAVFAARRLKIPSIVTCDSGEFVSVPQLNYGAQRVLGQRLAVRYACRKAAAVHVTSDYMRHLALRHKIAAECVPLGIELSRFACAIERPLGPPWVLLQVASLNRVKDQMLLLQALAELRQSLDVRLELAGEDTLSGELQRRAGELRVSDAVTFHGFVPQDRLAALHARAHLYVQSSRHEAAGVAVLEAAAAGLPIVGTRVGYVSDWDGAAVGVAPGDATALAQAIRTLLADPQRRVELSAAARTRVRDYDVARTAQAMRALYERVRRERAKITKDKTDEKDRKGRKGKKGKKGEEST